MQQQINVTLVVMRHPDGYNFVPFDHDPHPSRAAIVDGYVSALAQEGHQIERVEGYNHRANPEDYHPLDFHLKLVNGPRA